jgi:hypothetical protein
VKRLFPYFPRAFAAWLSCVVACLHALLAATSAHAGPFNVTLTIANPQEFTANQLQIAQVAAAKAELLWENVIVGYQPGISLMGISATITGTTTGFGQANFTGTVQQGGFRLSTGGAIQINVNILEEYSNFNGTGVNIIDELIAHEIGHVMGIGSLWNVNGLYVFGTGRYTGQYGLAAYRAEFDPTATFVPVELAGEPSTANQHWDQIMRSSVQEGNPSDPFSLSPLLGITDAQDRDFALELMTGAIDPDYGDPFLSNTTVQSLRDLGFAVVPEPPAWLLCLLATILAMVYSLRRAR